jgi:hypothetical protein
MSTSELLHLFLDCNDELITPEEAVSKIEDYYIAKGFKIPKKEPIFMSEELDAFLANEFANITTN